MPALYPDDYRYIRPEDRLYEAATALKSPSLNPLSRARYIQWVRDALTEIEYDPSIVPHDFEPIGPSARVPMVDDSPQA